MCFCMILILREGSGIFFAIVLTIVGVGNLPDGYTRIGPLSRVNTRVKQSGLSLAKPGRAMACATWNMANQGSTWNLLHRIR